MSDDPVIDPQAIENLRSLGTDGGAEFLRELIDIFIQDTPLHLAAIDQGLAAKDATSLIRAAHTIKGSSGNFGAGRLAKVAQEIEAHGKAGDLAAAAAACGRLRAEHALVAAELTKIAAGT